jgi:hypothetical protein
LHEISEKYATIVKMAAWQAVFGMLAIALTCCSGNDQENRRCSMLAPYNRPARFTFACVATETPEVSLTGACFVDDEGASRNTQVINWEKGVDVNSPRPGPCHVEVRIAAKLIFSEDITFESREASNGCGMPYTVPTQRISVVSDPDGACVDAGRLDSATDGDL